MYIIDSQKCDGCKKCMNVCETGAIYLVDGKARIEPSLCTECGLCVEACPLNAISVSKFEVQKKASSELSTKKSIASFAKAGLSVIGSALLPVLVEKMSDFLVSKVQETGSQPVKNKGTMSSSPRTGRRMRKRSRRNLRK